ncbi:MAG: hypothetical protein GY768_05830 [Planctomycetaceae bacterium]|nr:hypothetical protein [Planctomycetaceae bacterium]
MTFLQPFLLIALPLISLPIIIHLINRQRHRTVPWAAMMFLLDAKRMSRGMARLRYWLIMAMRMLAIAGLIFAVSRPLASGWLGSTIGGGADTTLVILDRSASNEQQELQTARSKRSAALEKLTGLFETVSLNGQLVLIENTENRAIPIELAEQLSQLPETQATATSSDIPAMLQTALDYCRTNQTGRTDIWICSDLRAHDWNPEDGRWPALRNEFEQLDGVRFYLLSYPESADDNLSVIVRNARLRKTARTAELTVDLTVRRDGPSNSDGQVPIEFIINGARSVLNIDLTENEFSLRGHTIELDPSTISGWGRVELPADANPEDNVFCFVFATPPIHRAVIVSDDERSAAALRTALSAPTDPDIRHESIVLTPERVDELDWTASSLIVWQAPLPDAPVGDQLIAFAKSGRPIVFFPPTRSTAGSAFGMQWGNWNVGTETHSKPITSWRNDSGLLEQTLSGQPLPVGKLKIFRHLELRGEANPLAQLDGGSLLLSQAIQTAGPVYFCTTLPRASHSTLAQDGIVFYVMLQRALSLGAATQSTARQVIAGTETAQQINDWKLLYSNRQDVISSLRWTQTGVMQQGDELVALNRSAAEDLQTTLDEQQINEVFGGLEYRQIQEEVSDRTALASEIWRAFLITMALALILEALLCIPERKPSSSTDSWSRRSNVRMTSEPVSDRS